MRGGLEELDGLVERVVASGELAASGVARGECGSVHWVVVDPTRHPFGVWQGTPTCRRVSELDAVVATNGPMMGRRVFGRKVTRGVLAAVPASLGIMAATVGPRLGRRRVGDRVAFGLTIAGATGYALLGGWVPCGIVRATTSGIDDRRDFDREGRDHAWIGRMSSDPADLAIGDGPLPDHVVDGCGGLVRLVDAGAIRREGDIVRLAGRRGVAAWGVAGNAVVIIGSADLDVAGAAEVMQRVGATDAIATDPSTCAFLATRGGFHLGPPSWARRRIQSYGLGCGAVH